MPKTVDPTMPVFSILVYWAIIVGTLEDKLKLYAICFVLHVVCYTISYSIWSIILGILEIQELSSCKFRGGGPATPARARRRALATAPGL